MLWQCNKTLSVKLAHRLSFLNFQLLTALAGALCASTRCVAVTNEITSCTCLARYSVLNRAVGQAVQTVRHCSAGADVTSVLSTVIADTLQCNRALLLLPLQNTE
jgi:hypothetical protein